MRLAAGLALALLAAPAAAQDLCPPLKRFLGDPAKAFAAARTGPRGPQLWNAAPIVPHATCDLWQSRGEDADTLHCTINDQAAQAAVAAFYQAGSASIDRCIATLPMQPWKRETAPVAVEGLRGTETTWLYDGDAIRLKISLTDYKRTVPDTSYNNFELRYLKY